jgi:hypothetical protein
LMPWEKPTNMSKMTIICKMDVEVERLCIA